jgi:hypothetical protein
MQPAMALDADGRPMLLRAGKNLAQAKFRLADDSTARLHSLEHFQKGIIEVDRFFIPFGRARMQHLGDRVSDQNRHKEPYFEN